MKRSIVALAATVMVFGTLAATAVAQPGGRGPGGFGGGFGGGGGLGLLQNEQIRKELEIVDDQIEQLTKLQEEAREQMRDVFSGLRDLDPEARRERFTEMREKMAEMQQEMQAKADKILLPHQSERLKQIGVQMQLRARGTSGALLEGELAETLKISDEQKKQLEEAAAKATEQMNEKIAAAREEARKQVLEALTPEQRAQLEKLTGKPFELSTQGGFGFRQRAEGDRERGDRGRRGRGDRNESSDE